MAVALVASAIVASRLLLRLAPPADWSEHSFLTGVDYASPLLRPFLTSPFDFLMTAVIASSLVALLLYAVEAWRLSRWHRRCRVTGFGPTATFVALQIGVGTGLAVLLAVHQAFLRDTLASTTLDLLHFSLHPWSASRLALQVGLIVWHATALGCGVLLLRAALVGWTVPRPDTRLRVVTIGFWALPLVLWQFVSEPAAARQIPPLIAVCRDDRARQLRHAVEGTVPARLAGVSADADDAGAGGAGCYLLSVGVSAWMAGEVAARRDALRFAGHQPAAYDSASACRKASIRSIGFPTWRSW